jgi:rare lipoprotein A
MQAWKRLAGLAGLLVVQLAGLTGCTTVPDPADPPPVVQSAPASTDIPAPSPGADVPNAGVPYTVDGVTYHPLLDAAGYRADGIASWYGPGFQGRRSSSGEVFDMYQLSAAHATLPLPTYVQVSNLENGRQLVVKVNDRGPFRKNRILDLSLAAARELDFAHKGTVAVRIEAITDPSDPRLLELAARGESVPDAGRVGRVAEIYVQVGAFRARERAWNLVDQIRQYMAHEQMVILEARVDQQLFYRVRMGPFATVDAADAAVASLERGKFGQSRIIVE